MPTRFARARVFNLTLGDVHPEGLSFSWHSRHLSEAMGASVRFVGHLTNDPALLDNETELAEYHSVNNKQNLGHNPRSSVQTGWLIVEYPDFPEDLTGSFVEDGNIFLGEVVAAILSFFQRRRILIGIVRFTSSQRYIIAMPPFFAGEWIDSVAYGPEALSPLHLEEGLVAALAQYEKMDDERKGRTRMLLARYNELLNLPYVHERTEGLWRIVEAIGRIVPRSPKATSEYRRLLAICGAKSSSNLELLVAALVHYGAKYSDDDVRDAREFRNHATHEYLDPKLSNWPSLVSSFYFLQRCADRMIAAELGLQSFPITDAGFTIIQNRVL
jgi:hypothetical protein